MSTKKDLSWVAFWVGAALIFNLGIYFFMGPQKALEFLGGYIIEQSLSIDNLFLFLVIFSSFGLESKYQHRVLNYGIFGAIVLRLIFVVLGVAVVNRFHSIMYIFGIILIVTGIKVLVQKEKEKDFRNSKLIKFIGKFIPFTHKLEGQKFFVKKNGILHATPLFAILLVIEGSDVIFAIDSIPAIFSITKDPFIIYSSNIFAIMGLRSMYFVLEKVSGAFRFVKQGVAMILTFTGVKLAILYFHIEIPIVLSIGIIFGILALSVIASVLYDRYMKDKKARLASVK
ncbi:tellurite resistance protein TerC [Desulfonispora thiosulfatigenes DSM 11270]|uniref:Tellurite resistance protein TerC n=1 Tax=Desulfonispora thiosulfatigenes DSM 11270 TaxID=656914 RepID=A0A1W1VDE2_DESTI|nr:TerC/Alx family metal homeostasis membrane protein [Desulfonispora thiosulfatigenes]SMB91388.1 tellurite resistance protein TerC [Desulfonispora thiosulfatigenes DSM 11270]